MCQVTTVKRGQVLFMLFMSYIEVVETIYIGIQRLGITSVFSLGEPYRESGSRSFLGKYAQRLGELFYLNVVKRGNLAPQLTDKKRESPGYCPTWVVRWAGSGLVVELRVDCSLTVD